MGNPSGAEEKVEWTPEMVVGAQLCIERHRSTNTTYKHSGIWFLIAALARIDEQDTEIAWLKEGNIQEEVEDLLDIYAFETGPMTDKAKKLKCKIVHLINEKAFTHAAASMRERCAAVLQPDVDRMEKHLTEPGYDWARLKTELKFCQGVQACIRALPLEEEADRRVTTGYKEWHEQNISDPTPERRIGELEAEQIYNGELRDVIAQAREIVESGLWLGGTDYGGGAVDWKKVDQLRAALSEVPGDG